MGVVVRIKDKLFVDVGIDKLVRLEGGSCWSETKCEAKVHLSQSSCRRNRSTRD